MTDYKEYLVAGYDEYVRMSGDAGVKPGVVRDHLSAKYADDVKFGLITAWQPNDIEAGIVLFNNIIMGDVRPARKTSFRDDVEYLVSAIRGETILGEDDPALNVAYSIGDGRDKILKLWTAEDWKQSVNVRFENLAKVTTAAYEFDQLVDELLSQMAKCGAQTTAQVLNGRFVS